ncbi:MAG: hypothetical protein Q9M92_06740 [Enterobacterales bacterium]|nr:hypothetical protein [Enterobacterales bacterium]
MKQLLCLTVIIGLFNGDVIYACENKVETSKSNKQSHKNNAKNPIVSKSKAGLSKPLIDAEKVKPEDKNQPIYIVPNQFPFKNTEQEKAKHKDCL